MYAGPGTRLQKRLARGDPGINPLDQACKEHDIAYWKHKDLESRHAADKVLQEKAWRRVKASDSSVGEKAAALFVTGAMKGKRTFGMGHCSRRKTGGMLPFMSLIKMIASVFKKKKGAGIGGEGVKSRALRAFNIGKKLVERAGGSKKVKIPRIIPVPKTGGFLPLIPLIIGGLSAAGALAGGGAAVAKSVITAKNQARELVEAIRHNKQMEAIALGKKGSGLYLKNYKKGYGLYFKQPKNY